MSEQAYVEMHRKIASALATCPEGTSPDRMADAVLALFPRVLSVVVVRNYREGPVGRQLHLETATDYLE